MSYHTIGRVAAYTGSSIESEPAYIRLCDDCPRRTGSRFIAKRNRTLGGILFARYDNAPPRSKQSLLSGPIIQYESDGTNGKLLGYDGQHSGAVQGLTPDNAEIFVRRVASCTGPINYLNACRALGRRLVSDAEGIPELRLVTEGPVAQIELS